MFPDEFVPAPVFNYVSAVDIKRNFVRNFITTPVQLSWWNNASHASAVTQICDYLFNNQIHDVDNDIEGFVNQFINQSILNPTLHFDFNASTKSPFNIDLSSIDALTPEGAKFNEVYGDLMTSSNFRHFFTSLFGQSPFINVKFEIVDIPLPIVGGTTDGLCGISYFTNQISSLNTIKIDRNHLLTKSKVNIALTILHECIHAFLNVKLRNPSIALPISQINNMDFQMCVNTYYNGFSGVQSEHSFMVNNMVPTMVQIFQDIKDLIVNATQANAIENPTNGGAFIYQPLYNPPTNEISDIRVPWNWNTFFRYLSYNGLQNCTAYPFSYPYQNNDDFYRHSYMIAFQTIFNP